MKYFLFIASTLFAVFSYIPGYAAINFDVTPIKYEIQIDPGSTISRTATITNRSSESFFITTGTSNFKASGSDGVPQFVRVSELEYPEQQLASWIDIDTQSFTLAGGASRTIQFDINVPSNATPGGHYGAVFFKNNAAQNTSGASVGVNVDYGVLILLNVSGDIVSDGNVDISQIYIGGGSGKYDRCGPLGDLSGDSYDGVCEALESAPVADDGIDVCPLGDFSPSNFDGICIDTPFQDPTNDQIDTDTPTGDEQQIQDTSGIEDDFNVVFDIPFENNGNIHLKPEGSIVIKDEDGNVIKNIGEKLIKNEQGAVVGKEIVDFLPINDEQGNVLPNSQRNFVYEWEGFPYKDIDGNISYRDPGEYYTIKNKNEAGFLMFWERVEEQKQNKTLTADIMISYRDHNGEEVEFRAAPEFPIQYIEQRIGMNPYIVFPLLLLGVLIASLWFYNFFYQTTTCIHSKCRKRIKKNMKVCPYCGKKQKKEKKKSKK